MSIKDKISKLALRAALGGILAGAALTGACSSEKSDEAKAEKSGCSGKGGCKSQQSCKSNESCKGQNGCKAQETHK